MISVFSNFLDTIFELGIKLIEKILKIMTFTKQRCIYVIIRNDNKNAAKEDSDERIRKSIT